MLFWITSTRKIFRADFNYTWPSLCTYTTGQILLQHLRHTRLMEQNLLQGLMGKSSESEFYKIALASNADSLATWLLQCQQTLF